MTVRTNHQPSQSGLFGTIAHRLCAGLVMFALLIALAPFSFAQDAAQLRRDVIGAGDFRVRVAAALALGKQKDKGSVATLVQALKDSNGAVRAAAAAALGSIGDPSAISPLESAKSTEKDGAVKSAIDRAIGTLQAAKKTRVIVSVAKIENKSGEPKVSTTFTSAVKSEVARLPGVEVASSEKDAVEQAKARNLPTIALDARLSQLSKSTSGPDVAIAARVELLIRKIPEQSLKATVKGDAKALMKSTSVKNDADLGALREDAVKAAVQSALKGAPTAIDAATK